MRRCSGLAMVTSGAYLFGFVAGLMLLSGCSLSWVGAGSGGWAFAPGYYDSSYGDHSYDYGRDQSPGYDYGGSDTSADSSGDTSSSGSDTASSSGDDTSSTASDTSSGDGSSGGDSSSSGDEDSVGSDDDGASVASR